MGGALNLPLRVLHVVQVQVQLPGQRASADHALEEGVAGEWQGPAAVGLVHFGQRRRLQRRQGRGAGQPLANHALLREVVVLGGGRE